MDLSWAAAAAAAAALFIGGSAKGATGFGMPLVALPIMTSFIDVRIALPLMSMPILAGNIWQATQGGMFIPVARRFWWLFVAMGIGCAVGAALFVRIDPSYIFLFIGLSVIAFALINLLAFTLSIPARREHLFGVVAGVIGGVMGGISTFFGPPLIMYFIALHMRHDFFVATLGVTWLLASLMLLVSFLAVDILTWHLALLSLGGILPVLAGMAFGRWMAMHVRQDLVRKGILLLLLVVGVNLVRRALW